MRLPPTTRAALAAPWLAPLAGCVLVLDGTGQERTRSVRHAAAPAPARPADVPAISPATLYAHVRVLASDEFEGRGPGTPGEDRTVDYLVQAMKAIGLEPGNPDGSWVQPVPLVGLRREAQGALEAGGRSIALAMGEECVALSRRQQAEVRVEGSPIVFVGYGAVAPEYGWDDLGDADLAGKTLVFLVNDPPVRDPDEPDQLDPDVFGGRAMTYYGRWTYKYEIASQRGAAAAIVVHETEPASYPWSVVQSSWGQESFDLKSEDQGRSRVAIESWITVEKARELFTAAGQDFDALKERARTRGFRPVALEARASFTVHSTLREVASRNVIGKLPGADPARAGEAIVYTAHWDHLGRNEALEVDGGDGIYNGALDNASGCAGVLAIAEAFTRLDPPPARTILFLFVTAEEKGLLGSRWYATHPLHPLERTLANVNMDSLNPWGPTRDLIVIGHGQSTLDDLLAEAAAARGRVLVPDTQPEKGLYYRSDHFEFAQAGVPAIYADGGEEVLGRPAGWGRGKIDEYVARDYHKPSDEVQVDWDLSGAARDMELLLDLGARIARASAWPEWKPRSEFRARRLEQLGRSPER